MSDTGDFKQVKKNKKKVLLRREKETEELKSLLSSPIMRHFMWRVLERCGVYTTSFTGESAGTFFNEGQRQIGLWLLTEIEDSDKNALSTMQLEQRNYNE